MIVRRLGFEALSAIVEVRENDTLRLALTMYPVAVALDTTRVMATAGVDRLAGFEDRRKHEIGGKYISREEIEKQAPVITTDLLRRVLGISVVEAKKKTQAWRREMALA